MRGAIKNKKQKLHASLSIPLLLQLTGPFATFYKQQFDIPKEALLTSPEMLAEDKGHIALDAGDGEMDRDGDGGVDAAK